MTDRAASEEDRFNQALGRHGYAFHEAVVDAAKSDPDVESSWSVDVTELPVRAGAADTRVDIVLSHTGLPALIVAECKYANAALDWGFARSHSMARTGPVVERLSRRGESLAGQILTIGSADPGPYSVQLNLRTGRQGQETGAPPKAFDDAVTQVVRALNGLVNLAHSQHGDWINERWEGPSVAVVPMIFTTARLYVTDDRLGPAYLDRPGAGDPFTWRQVPLLYYDHPQSESMLHEDVQIPQDRRCSLAALWISRFVRSIVVVSVQTAVDVHNALHWTRDAIHNHLKALNQV